RREQAARLIEDAEATERELAMHVVLLQKVVAVVVEGAGRGRVQADERAHDGALARAAAAGDEEDGAVVDGEVEVLHDHEAAVRQRQPFDGDLRVLGHQIFKMLRTTANRPSMAMIQTMEATTAPVAASPTAAAPLDARKPSTQPATATMTPNT